MIAGYYAGRLKTRYTSYCKRSATSGGMAAMTCKPHHLPICEDGIILIVDPKTGREAVRFCAVCRPGQAALQRAGAYDPARAREWSAERRAAVYAEGLAAAGIEPAPIADDDRIAG